MEAKPAARKNRTKLPLPEDISSTATNSQYRGNPFLGVHPFSVGDPNYISRSTSNAANSAPSPPPRRRRIITSKRGKRPPAPLPRRREMEIPNLTDYEVPVSDQAPVYEVPFGSLYDSMTNRQPINTSNDDIYSLPYANGPRPLPKLPTNKKQRIVFTGNRYAAVAPRPRPNKKRTSRKLPNTPNTHKTSRKLPNTPSRLNSSSNLPNMSGLFLNSKKPSKTKKRELPQIPPTQTL